MTTNWEAMELREQKESLTLKEWLLVIFVLVPVMTLALLFFYYFGPTDASLQKKSRIRLRMPNKFELVGFTGTALTAVSLLSLGQLSIYGWVAAITGSLVWMAYAMHENNAHKRDYPVFFTNILFIAIDIRGLILWAGI